MSAGGIDNTRDAGLSATSAGPLTTQGGAVVINDHDVSNNATTATPYPSTISIIGGRAGTVTKVRVGLNGFTAVRPDDVDMLLVSPSGATFILFSDVGGLSAVGPVTLTLDDAAASSLRAPYLPVPLSQLMKGRCRILLHLQRPRLMAIQAA